MIGKVTLVVDECPHCTNGWAGTKKRPACSYTGGHYCDRLRGHEGRCRCSCGSSHAPLRPDQKDLP